MKKYLTLLCGIFLCVSSVVYAKKHHELVLSDANTWNNNIPPRLQWNENYGYCGEVCMISAGLYYGQYLSQYAMRGLASPGIPQNKSASELLLGQNDMTTATQLHLKAIEWNGNNTHDFLAWVKQNVVNGFPVAMGVYANENLFYEDTDPDAGDAQYDHIVPVTGIHSNHPLTDDNYYSDDILYFSDNGLWDPTDPPVYNFQASFGAFQATRRQANSPTGAIYSLSDATPNYGIAITGVMDLNGETLPIRLDTNFNYECPEIQDKTSIPPAPMPLTLTITVSHLQPGVLYNLYRYEDILKVPNSDFNAHAESASKKWQIQITSGTTYIFSEQIQSNETVIYRAVRAE